MNPIDKHILPRINPFWDRYTHTKKEFIPFDLRHFTSCLYSSFFVMRYIQLYNIKLYVCTKSNISVLQNNNINIYIKFFEVDYSRL